MPLPLLIVLVVAVGAYGLAAGVAALGIVAALRQDPPPAPSEWPTVSVMGTSAPLSPGDLPAGLQDCESPPERLEILRPAEVESAENAPAEESAGRTDRPDSNLKTPSSGSPIQRRVQATDAEVVLTVPAEGTVEAGWIRSMVRRCTSSSPVVAGPTIIDHDDLFLPRLQALSHLGRLAFTAGFSHFGLPTLLETSNRAVRVDALHEDGDRVAPPDRRAVSHPTTFNPEADALLTRPPVESFDALLRRLSEGFRRVWVGSWGVWAQGVGLWFVHTVLLISALGAVALPAWRQPVLIALLAKMGTDVLLSFPAARHYGQRGLFRSTVPTELMLLLAIPAAGLRSLPVSPPFLGPKTERP